MATIIGYSRGYERRNGITSTFIAHPTLTEAVADAQGCLRARGVVKAWVRAVYPGLELGPVLWSAAKAGRHG